MARNLTAVALQEINLTTDPTTAKTYGYSSENLLKTATGGVTLGYDPMLRLHQVAGAATTRLAYDGLAMIAEYNASNALQRRFVHGPAVDEPLVQYEGTGTTDRRWLHADERGSVVAISDASGNMLTINSYDEYGKPQATNAGRFQYTGQMWLGEIGLYHYKARAYAPHLGRFLQTDPIEYWGGMNLYAYVGNDPVNFTDPLGLNAIVITGNLDPKDQGAIGDFLGAASDYSLRFPELAQLLDADEEIVVTCDAACRARRRLAGMHELADDSGKHCSGNSRLAKLGQRFEIAADVTAGAAIALGITAVVTSGSGAGGVGFGTAAVAAQGTSVVASGLAVLAYAADGNWSRAGINAFGLIGGRGLSAGLSTIYSRPNIAGKAAEKFNDVAADVAGTAGEKIGVAVACGG